MKNYNPKNPINQAQFHKAQNILLEYAQAMRGVLNYIIQIQSRYKQVFPKQQTIADHLGLSREYVNKVLALLEKHGWLKSYYRNNHPKIYCLSSIFFSWQFCDLFSTLLPGLNLLKTSGIVLGLMLSNIASATKVHTYIKNSSSYTKFIYKHTYSYTYVEEKTSKKNSASTFCNRKNYLNKKESSMDDNFYQILTETEWLTNLGRAGLSAYPEKAVAYALQSIKRNNPRTVRDPFKLLCKIAKDYVADNSLSMDWKRAKQLEEKYSHLIDHIDRDLFVNNSKTSLKGEKRESVSSTELREQMKAQDSGKKLYDKDYFDEIKNFYKLINQPNFQWMCQQVGKPIIPGYILDVLFFADTTPGVLNELVRQYPPLSEAVGQIAQTGKADLGFEGYWMLEERPYILARQI